MKKPYLLLGLLIALIGIAVFMLPHLISGQSGNAELAERTGQIGGALMAVGAMLAIIGLLKKPNKGD